MSDCRVIVQKVAPQKDFILVEYPGLVQNDEKMLHTLGGIPKISQAFCGDKRRLELRFHPDNVFNKPVYGELQQTSGLLLRIKIRRRKNSTSSEPPTHIVQILGHCRRCVNFEALCDYQYLPVLLKKEGTVECVYDNIVPKGLPDQDWFSEVHKPLYCAPVFFARIDTIPSKIYRGDQKNFANPDILDSNRHKPAEVCEFQAFNLSDPFPTKPNPEVVKRMTIKYVSDKQLDKVKKLFEECPIWNRIALMYEAQLSLDKIKNILPYVAYYFTSGPWRTLYARYGYDPRKHFESRYYQAIHFRLRYDPGITEYIKEKKKARMEANKMSGLYVNSSSSNQTDGFIQDINYPYFEEGHLPRSRQCIYRYCDIKIAKVKEMLDKIPTPLSGATCNEKTGWLPSGFDNQVRQIVSSCIKEQLVVIRQHNKANYEEEEEEEIEEEDDDENIEEDFDQLMDEMDLEENIF